MFEKFKEKFQVSNEDLKFLIAKFFDSLLLLFKRNPGVRAIPVLWPEGSKRNTQEQENTTFHTLPYLQQLSVIRLIQQ